MYVQLISTSLVTFTRVAHRSNDKSNQAFEQRGTQAGVRVTFSRRQHARSSFEPRSRGFPKSNRPVVYGWCAAGPDASSPFQRASRRALAPRFSRLKPPIWKHAQARCGRWSRCLTSPRRAGLSALRASPMNQAHRPAQS